MTSPCLNELSVQCEGGLSEKLSRIGQFIRKTFLIRRELARAVEARHEISGTAGESVPCFVRSGVATILDIAAGEKHDS